MELTIYLIDEFYFTFKSISYGIGALHYLLMVYYLIFSMIVIGNSYLKCGKWIIATCRQSLWFYKKTKDSKAKGRNVKCSS